MYIKNNINYIFLIIMGMAACMCTAKIDKNKIMLMRKAGKNRSPDVEKRALSMKEQASPQNESPEPRKTAKDVNIMLNEKISRPDYPYENANFNDWMKESSVWKIEA